MNIKRLITFLVFICFIGNVKSAVNTDSTKIYFDNALEEVKEMLEGSRPLDFQRAVFITENAYFDNSYEYKKFQDLINLHTFFISQLINTNYNDTLDFNVKVQPNGRFNIDEIRYTPEQKKELYTKVLSNWAIFIYLTDTTRFGSLTHYPYGYNAKDPFGMNDWKNSQTINLLTSKDNLGNCFALTAFFKILANQLNSDAVICTAPQHIYIQHKDHKGHWYNVELATAGHPADGSIQTLTYTTNKALMNNIALRTLDEKQSVALCLVNLAKSYEHKYNNKTDEFLLQCAELALKHDPKNLNALLLKQQVLDARVIEYARENKLNSIEKLRKDKNINNQLEQLENHLALLSELGYIQMPVDMQEVVLNGFKGENTAQFIQKNKNPNPFTSIDVPEEENQYLSLSHGIFQEVFEPKEIETYGHFTFNTKNNEITKIDTQTVNNQLIDPVAFAYDLGARMYDARLGRMLSIDPLVAKYPDYSPYSFAINNPILFVDKDGQEPVKEFVGTSADFASVLNNSPNKVGGFVGTAAVDYLVGLGSTEFKWSQMRPFPTQTGYFNQKKGRYVYTERGGWIDMTHFLFYAGKAYKYQQEGEKYPIGKALQEGLLQEISDMAAAEHSAFSYEDLPSDKYGADFAINYFDPESELTFAEQVQNYLDVVLGAKNPEDAPNYDALPETDAETAGTPPTDTNMSSFPKYTSKNSTSGAGEQSSDKKEKNN